MKKAPLLPIMQGSKPSQTIFVSVKQILCIFYHSKNTLQCNGLFEFISGGPCTDFTQIKADLLYATNIQERVPRKTTKLALNCWQQWKHHQSLPFTQRNYAVQIKKSVKQISPHLQILYYGKPVKSWLYHPHTLCLSPQVWIFILDSFCSLLTKMSGYGPLTYWQVLVCPVQLTWNACWNPKLGLSIRQRQVAWKDDGLLCLCTCNFLKLNLWLNNLEN